MSSSSTSYSKAPISSNDTKSYLCLTPSEWIKNDKAFLGDKPDGGKLVEQNMAAPEHQTGTKVTSAVSFGTDAEIDQLIEKGHSESEFHGSERVLVNEPRLPNASLQTATVPTVPRTMNNPRRPSFSEGSESVNESAVDHEPTSAIGNLTIESTAFQTRMSTLAAAPTLYTEQITDGFIRVYQSSRGEQLAYLNSRSAELLSDNRFTANVNNTPTNNIGPVLHESSFTARLSSVSNDATLTTTQHHLASSGTINDQSNWSNRGMMASENNADVVDTFFVSYGIQELSETKQGAICIYQCALTGERCHTFVSGRDRRNRYRHLATHAQAEQECVAQGYLSAQQTLLMTRLRKIVVTCVVPGCEFRKEVWRTDRVREEHEKDAHPDVYEARRQRQKKGKGKDVSFIGG